MGHKSVLECILDGDEEPKDLPIALLQHITDNFSEERKIGQGGFGAVYKGVLRNGIVAVKRIDVNIFTMDDKSFRREIESLMKINHQNVVRFLGFCCNTHSIWIEEPGTGKNNLVNVRERLLCLEYIRSGSLDKHITDELRGLEWETRYEIIIGICMGLRYLHEVENIVHMDLKPANILLDDKNVPKITDFGLARPNGNTHTTGQRFGTRGYLAPEYENTGETSVKSDVYSLGAIITELVTGCMSVPDQNNVLRRWRHRWSMPPTVLQYQQVTRCIEIAVCCRKEEPKHRPSISDIISFLTEPQRTDGYTGQLSPYFDDDMLGIKPLELWLPSNLMEEIPCFKVELTNDTCNCIAFNIQPPSGQQYTTQPDKGIVQPESKYDVKITVQAHHVHDSGHAAKFVVQSMKCSDNLKNKVITESMFHEEVGKVVDEVDLMVVYEPTKPQENYKSKEDTNMPTEEVPEVKKGEIIESTSKKGKLGSIEKTKAGKIMKDLNDATNNLLARSKDIRSIIDTAERKGLKSTNEVDVWLEKVAIIISSAHIIYNSYELNKDIRMEVAEKLSEIKECLRSCPDNNNIALELVPPPAQEIPGPSMVLPTENYNLQKALHFIRGDIAGMIGIWGQGGVGKTYLLKSINNSIAVAGGMSFNVIFVTASSECSVETIQGGILDKLGMNKDGTVESKRQMIFNFLKNRSFLVLLDDLWEQIDLEAVGLPYPLGTVDQLKRKVVLTTRLRKVCGEMEVREELKVTCLREDDAWQLFKEKVGQKTFSSVPCVEALARELVKELKGLPLALIVVGRAMYQKTDRLEWEHAIEQMKLSCWDENDPLNMEEKVFRQLKFSYDSLKSDTLRRCFLTCVLWPEDFEIIKADLAQCWIGLGLVDGDIQRSHRKAYSLIGDLKDACLLDNWGNWYGFVKVHDVIRDMALWISCGCGENNNKWFVRAKVVTKERLRIPWSKAEYISLMLNEMRKLPPFRIAHGPMKLRMLCLQNNYFDGSIVETIKHFTSLRYLDLRTNLLKDIPAELCSLENLEYLDLSHNPDLYQLPYCFKNLIKLKFLYLQCTDIRIIPKEVISNLYDLQVIDLRTWRAYRGGGSVNYNPAIFLELGTLDQLDAAGIETDGLSEYESLRDAASLPIRSLIVGSLRETRAFCLSGILSVDFAQQTLYELEIILSNMEGIIVTQEPNYRFGNLNKLLLWFLVNLKEITWVGRPPASVFPMLTCLDVNSCYKLENLSWVIYLPCLEQLEARFCDNMKEAFLRTGHNGETMSTDQESSMASKGTFPCLKQLRLSDNPKLITICDPDVTFPSLEQLVLTKSPELIRLPFQMGSLPAKLWQLRLDNVECWDRLEMEDGVKSLLRPSLIFWPPAE